jgi:phosphoribosylpyrophosphate synthetase
MRNAIALGLRVDINRLGIELAKTMSLNYSNQETSVTVGESVRDEDGTSKIQQSSWKLEMREQKANQAYHSIHPTIHGARRHQ